MDKPNYQPIADVPTAHGSDNHRQQQLSVMMYAKYVLQVRDNFNMRLQYDKILAGEKLTQQYILDLFLIMESNNHEYIRRNQDKLKTADYTMLKEAIAANEARQEGKYVVLPSTSIGSPRWYAGQYHDGMARVRQLGKPDLFVTFTANPDWPELKGSMRQSQQDSSPFVMHRPDLVSRVFNMKLRALIKDIIKNNVFGRPIAHIYVVEWQKRGLPHAHILIFLAPEDKPKQPFEYDHFMTAELPDPTKHPDLFELVKKHMVHGPCGEYNNKCPCMRNGRCTKKYPKQFAATTTHKENDYPSPRRRSPADGGQQYIITRSNGTTVTVDNRWIVPYNPYLLSKYRTHINVEICNSIKAIKYLHKYIYKGTSKAIIAIHEVQPNSNQPVNIDEISMYTCTLSSRGKNCHRPYSRSVCLNPSHTFRC
jgi:hypothetical protein